MIMTIMYGLICLASSSISVDYNILAGTVTLDAIFIVAVIANNIINMTRYRK